MRCVLFFIVAVFGWLVAVADAAPRLVKSLAAQQPPVARVGANYVFTILPDTFAAGKGVNYTASGLPAWLQFSSINPTFHGTPTSNDVGESEIVLVATDATGATRSTFTLIVSNFDAPVVNMGIAEQLKDPKSRDISSATVMPGNNGVSVPPFWSFSLGWSGRTFVMANRNNNGKLYYSAYVRGQTGLPDWLEFSNTTYTFNGVSPANGTYEVVLVGTDYWNHTAAETSFILSVGEGSVVENSKPLQPIRTVSRNLVSYPLDLSGLLVNGQKADASQVSVSPDLSQTSWLSFDKSSNTFSGTTPDNLVNGTAAPFSIPVTLSSSSNASNTLSYVSYLNVSILPYAFKTFQLPNTTVQAGQQFTFDLSKFLVNASADTASINATVVPGSAAAWLLYHPDNYTLTGNPSPNISYSAITVTFMSTTGGATSVTNITMPIDGVMGPQGNGDSAPVPMAPHSKGGLSKKDKIIIGCVVGLGVPLLILLALLLFCCLRKRRRNERKGVDVEKEGTPDTLTNTPPAKSAKSAKTDGAETILGGSSPTKNSGARRFPGIKGLFAGPTADPVLPTRGSGDTVRPPSDNGSFHGQGDILAVGGNRNVGTSAAHQHPGGASRSAVSFDSMDSFAASGPSMHWSGEEDYLEPLYERDNFDAMTPTSAETGAVSSPTTQASTLATPTFAAAPLAAVTPGSLADSHRPRTVSTGRDLDDPAGDVPRPLPGFYPKFPRNMRPGDPAPFLSTDDVSMHFSEFDRDTSENDVGHSRSLVTSRSLDSFADQGSQLGGGSSGSRFGSSKHSRSASSGAWWGGSGLPAGSSGGMSGSGSSAEQAIVATAHRQSLETQRSSAVNEVIDFSNAEYSHSANSAVTPPNMTPTTPTRPVSYLVVPAHVQQSYTPSKAVPAARRHSSSRRQQTARVQTREQIMGGASHADGQPIVFSQPIPRADYNRHYT